MIVNNNLPYMMKDVTQLRNDHTNQQLMLYGSSEFNRGVGLIGLYVRNQVTINGEILCVHDES